MINWPDCKNGTHVMKKMTWSQSFQSFFFVKQTLFLHFLRLSLTILFQIQWNSVITNSVVNEHSVITNRFLGQIGQFTTQSNPVVTNKYVLHFLLSQSGKSFTTKIGHEDKRSLLGLTPVLQATIKSSH